MSRTSSDASSPPLSDSINIPAPTPLRRNPVRSSSSAASSNVSDVNGKTTSSKQRIYRSEKHNVPPSVNSDQNAIRAVSENPNTSTSLILSDTTTSNTSDHNITTTIPSLSLSSSTTSTLLTNGPLRELDVTYQKELGRAGHHAEHIHPEDLGQLSLSESAAVTKKQRKVKFIVTDNIPLNEEKRLLSQAIIRIKQLSSSSSSSPTAATATDTARTATTTSTSSPAIHASSQLPTRLQSTSTSTPDSGPRLYPEPLYPQNVPSNVLKLLKGTLKYPTTLFRLNVLGGGRCSVAALLLATGFVPDQHSSEEIRERIDNHRRDIGESMKRDWTEEAWIQEVPIELRGAHTKWHHIEGTPNSVSAILRTSFDEVHDLLTNRRATIFLDHTVFYLASPLFSVGMFIIYVAPDVGKSVVRCRRIGENHGQHIVLYHINNHYECLQYNGQRMFKNDNDLIIALTHLNITHPPHIPIEDDQERMDYIHNISINNTVANDMSTTDTGTATSTMPSITTVESNPGTGTSIIKTDTTAPIEPETSKLDSVSCIVTTVNNAVELVTPPARQRLQRQAKDKAATAIAEQHKLDMLLSDLDIDKMSPTKPVNGSLSRTTGSKIASSSTKTNAEWTTLFKKRSKKQQQRRTTSLNAKTLHPPPSTRTAVSELAPTAAKSPFPVASSLPSVADIAAHEQLYDFVSFTNVPQWVGICGQVFNQYRAASQDGNRQAQTQALVDILMLPQRVLTKTARGGTNHKGRIIATVKARCRDLGDELRQRYMGQDNSIDNNVKLTITTTPLMYKPAENTVQNDNSEIVASPSIVSTDDEQNDTDDPLSQPGYCHSNNHTSSPQLNEEHGLVDSRNEDTANHDTDEITRCPSTTSALHVTRRVVEQKRSEEEDSISNDGPSDINDTHNLMYEELGISEDDNELKAVKRAKHLVSQGHIKRASKTLHSTTTMADLTDPQHYNTITKLHPSLPSSSIIPSLPSNARQVILEDDEVMKRLIRSSNNGACSGPSGWGGNLLSSLVESPICRSGVIALLKDIINGTMSEEARQYLCASRLFGLAKPDNGIRPIAAGEIFYRLAGVLAVRSVTKAASTLLKPHQYGIGISSGCEMMVHAMQHTLADTTKKHAVLKIDITNAFNTCNRADMLTKLYATPELKTLYRIADFAYSTPSQLLLQGCDGKTIQSTNGVRQGDPLACLLFCLYMRDIYDAVSKQAKVTLYAYIDDLHVVGTPNEVMKAFTALQSLLPAASLTCNTAKSHFAYFHQDIAPLHRNVLDTFAEHNITIHHDWMEVVGAVIGCDDESIQRGVREVFNSEGNDAFFNRLQSPDMPVQMTMLLLRQCAVPQMNYLLRCTPPPCIAALAGEYDETIVNSAWDKLEIRRSEVTDETRRILTMKLTYGGFGMSPTLTTSPGAYLGSVAAARTAKVFDAYTDPGDPPTPLPATTQLHGWLQHSIDKVMTTTPPLKDSLPPSASSFFSFYTNAKSSLSSSLQHIISMQATTFSYVASLELAREMKKQDGGSKIAHMKAYSAPKASVWKSTTPTTKELQLTDVEYRMSARLNLRLQPFACMDDLPASCPMCDVKHAKSAIAKDSWHFLTCNHVKKDQYIRHNAIADALYHTVLVVGGQAAREPKDMSAEDNKKPDLQIVLPGHHLVTDVVVTHPLTYSKCKDRNTTTAYARIAQSAKHAKYNKIAQAHHAQLLPFAVETSGGMAPDAMTLLQIISKSGKEHLGLWSRREVESYVMSAVATAIQRGTVKAMISGYMATVVCPTASAERQ
jgi:hypothetical protein